MTYRIIGLDEVGRGSIAGPVAVGMCAVRDPQILKIFSGVKDSKALTKVGRSYWFQKIQEMPKSELIFDVAYVEARSIDRYGIGNSLRTLIARLLKRNRVAPLARVLLDGSLRAPLVYLNQQTIISGDAKEPIIALASIAAKVLRDRRISRYEIRYPEFSFSRHKGYGTSGHIEEIKKHGITPEHRVSFLKKVYLPK